jgi:hypothetical protein
MKISRRIPNRPPYIPSGHLQEPYYVSLCNTDFKKHFTAEGMSHESTILAHLSKARLPCSLRCVDLIDQIHCCNIVRAAALVVCSDSLEVFEKLGLLETLVFDIGMSFFRYSSVNVADWETYLHVLPFQ